MKEQALWGFRAGPTGRPDLELGLGAWVSVEAGGAHPCSRAGKPGRGGPGAPAEGRAGGEKGWAGSSPREGQPGSPQVQGGSGSTAQQSRGEAPAADLSSTR